MVAATKKLFSKEAEKVDKRYRFYLVINLLTSEEETQAQFPTPSAVHLHKLEELQQHKYRIIHSQSRKYPVGTQLGWAVRGFKIF